MIESTNAAPYTLGRGNSPKPTTTLSGAFQGILDIFSRRWIMHPFLFFPQGPLSCFICFSTEGRDDTFTKAFHLRCTSIPQVRCLSYTPAASQSPFKILGRVSCVLEVLFPRVPNKSDPNYRIMESAFLPESHFFYPPRNAFYCIRRQSMLGYIEHNVTGPRGFILITLEPLYH
jgi:hypothetical protein